MNPSLRITFLAAWLTISAALITSNARGQYIVTELGSLGGSTGTPVAISSNGQIVGQATLPSGDNHGFYYSGGVTTDVGTLGGTSSVLYDVNDSGVAVGAATDSFGNWHAVTFQPDVGVIVGDAQYQIGHPQHAFIYSGGVMRDLNSMIPSGSGWELLTATDINDSGDIVGWGYLNGQEHGFLLTAVPEARLYAIFVSGSLLAWAVWRKFQCSNPSI